MTVSVAPQYLERLGKLYTMGYYDAFIDSALQRIVTRQIVHDKTDLRQIEADLAHFEQEYGMTSDQFWKQYQAGKMADTADYMEWNVLLKSRRRVQERLRVLGDDDAK
jgi:hypothetical protein